MMTTTQGNGVYVFIAMVKRRSNDLSIEFFVQTNNSTE